MSKQQPNLIDAIRTYGPREMFHGQLAELDRQVLVLTGERYRLEQVRGRQLKIPSSPAELHAQIEQAVLSLSTESPEFERLMGELVPEFHVYLVRMCDGGHLLPQIRVKLDLSGICTDAELVTGVPALLSSTLTLDVFEPTQRERIREQAALLVSQGMRQRDACLQIAERPTQPALQNALKIDRLMQDRGLKSPYILQTSPPDDYIKLLRHRAAHFRFEPLPGYVPPALE